MSTPVSVQSFNKLLPIPGVRFRPLVYDQATGQYIVLDSAGQLGISGGGGGDDSRIPDSTVAGSILAGDGSGSWVEDTSVTVSSTEFLAPGKQDYNLTGGNFSVGFRALPTGAGGDVYSGQYSDVGGFVGGHFFQAIYGLGGLVISQHGIERPGGFWGSRASATDLDTTPVETFSLFANNLVRMQINGTGIGFFAKDPVARPNLVAARAAIFAELATLNGVAAGLGTSLLALFDALGNDTGGLGLTQTV